MTRKELLREALGRWQAAADRGAPITAEDACRDHPDLLPEFARLLARVGRVQSALGGDAPPPPVAAAAGGHAPRYSPRTLLGKGGQGVVYLADDAELNRLVAYKVLRDEAEDDADARGRFLTEAELTGQLDHPGVVPVYGRGRDADGRPYYAMRVVRGGTFGEAVERLYATDRAADEAAWDVEFRRLLRAFASACQTVAYAHSRGVVHRDLKPANVMLGPFGETLVVDWGLAKRTDRPDPTPAGSTVDPVPLKAEADTSQYGEAKGSPAFMPPEQARGDWDRVGPAADVYALGATLYALLTGERPYSGRSSADVIEAVRAGRLRRPRAVRAGVPRALEAVCLKAMAARPGDRYPTAAALTDDVDRWAAGQPVSAHREPVWVRAGRWVRRHRAAVAVGVATVAAAAVALAVFGAVLAATNGKLTKANGDLTKANTDLVDAEAARQADFDEADDALRVMAGAALAPRPMGADAKPDDLRVEAVRRYRDHLRRYLDRERDRPEPRLPVALAHLRLGEACALLEDDDDAVAAFAAAEEAFAALRAGAADDRELLFGWACAVGGRGRLLNKAFRLREAEPPLLAARAAFETLCGDPAPIRLARSGLGEAGGADSPALRLADVTLALGVQANLDQAARSPTAPGGSGPTERYRKWLRTASGALGGRAVPPEAPLPARVKAAALLMALSDTEDGDLGDVRAAAALLRPIKAAYPLYAEPQYKLALAEVILANAIAVDPVETEKNLAVAAAELERLDGTDHGLDPSGLRQEGVIARGQLAQARMMLAHLQGDGEAARKHAATAVGALGRLRLAKRPRADRVAAALVLYAQLAGVAALDKAAAGDAERCYADGLALIATLPPRSAADPTVKALAATFHVGLANVRVLLGNAAGADADEAEKLFKELRAAGDPPPELPVAEAWLCIARVSEALKTSRQAALKVCEEGRKALAKVERPTPAADGIAYFDYLLTFQAAVLHGAIADDMLTAKPNDPDALAEVRLGIALLKGRTPPAIDDAALAQSVKSRMLADQKSLLGHLAEVEARAGGGK